MMAGREYWSRSAPTGRSPSSVKWLCCAIGACCAVTPRSAGALCACKCTKKCGARTKVEVFLLAVLARRDESAQWAEKSGEVLRKMSLLFAKSPRVFGDTCPFFVRSCLCRASLYERLGTSARGDEKRLRSRTDRNEKSPSSPRRGRGVRSQNDRVRGDQRAL